MTTAISAPTNEDVNAAVSALPARPCCASGWAVERGRDRPGLARNVEKYRGNGAAEKRSPVDARQQDDGRGGAAGLLRHGESERQQDRDAVRSAKPREHADDDAEDDAHEHQHQG